MLGNYSICEAPLAAFPEFAYAVSVAEGAGVSESTFVASSVFNGAIANTATASETASAATVFVSAVSDTAAGTDSSSALLDIVVGVTQSVAGADSISVAPSTFSAAVAVESVSASDRAVAYAVFIAAVTGNAVGADQVLSRFLWEIIDDSQTPNWQNISTN